MESNIHEAEEKLKDLTRQSLLPENTSDSSTLLKLTDEMAKTQSEIERMYARWSELENKK
jgi:hypothetical protein